jgi:hypothetical protein
MTRKKNYKHNLSVRISEAQRKRWERFADGNGFASVSSLIRFATDELVEGKQSARLQENNKQLLRNRLNELEGRYDALLDSQREIMSMIAKKSSEIRKDKPLREYQKGLIINLLKEEPRDEVEIQKILSDLSEVEVITLLNELMETSIIKQEKNKYAVI